MHELEPLADDTEFQREWQAVKADNKRALASIIKERTGVNVDPHSLFDIQVKRLHEYKRQHLNVLYLVTLYNRLRRDSSAADVAAHCYLWRQGRARISDGQTDHQVDQLRCRGWSINDPAVSRASQSGFLARLQCQEQSTRLSGSRSVGTDFHRREGGVGHGEYEVRYEWRADHRHAGRRQH